jgi:hypothetical protein
MQSRDTRFYLRIESGDNQGDEIPLPDGPTRLGRKPDNSVVLRDGSVSGHHAEIRVRAGEAQLVDLGSTNGTKVGGKRVEQARLAHGDPFWLGSVKFRFFDAQLSRPAGATPLEGAGSGSPGSAPAHSGASSGSGSEAPALERVSSEQLTRSRAGSRRGLFLLGLLALGAGAVLLWRWQGRRQEAVQATSIPSVPGNLLGDASFEEGSSEWLSAESAPLGFLRERSAARSGQVGLGVTLGPEDWSLARSAEFELRPRRRLTLGGELRTEQESAGRLGVELSSADGSQPAFIAWSPAQRTGGEFRSIELSFDTLGGYDRGRLVIAGRGPGTLALDDVRALLGEPAGDNARFNEYELAVLGAGGSTAALVRSGRVLLSGFDLSSWTREGLEGWPESRLVAQATERGFTLRFPGAPQDAVLSFRAVRAGANEERGWVSSTGPGGYAAHSAEFTRSGATDLLLGRGLELLRIGFERPVDLEGSWSEGSFHLRIRPGGQEQCEFQLTFREERAEANTLSGRADQLERSGDLGGAIALWTQLLDRFPFERALVTRAEETRARLVQSGLSEVEVVRSELERARFFGLPELFRSGRERAEELARRFRGSEVEVEARAVAEQAQRELQALGLGLRAGERELLRGVLATLDPARAPRLAEHVRAALKAVDPGSGED